MELNSGSLKSTFVSSFDYPSGFEAECLKNNWNRTRALVQKTLKKSKRPKRQTVRNARPTVPSPLSAVRNHLAHPGPFPQRIPNPLPLAQDPRLKTLLLKAPQDPSARSGFRLQAPASLTPATRLNLDYLAIFGDFGNAFGLAARRGSLATPGVNQKLRRMYRLFGFEERLPRFVE
jgi:hypothetical protein